METTRPSTLRLLMGWNSATEKSNRSLMGLSEKLATRTMVSPSLGITKERATSISDLPLCSLDSSKIPGVPVLRPREKCPHVVHFNVSRDSF